MTKQELLLDTCLLAGKIMMENGSEVYRVEDTMNRIATNAGEENSISYVTATGLFMGLRKSHYAQVEDVQDRTINLEKIVAVNQLSRRFANCEITLEELYQELLLVNKTTPAYPFPLQILSAGLVSCTLMYIFGGGWSDFFATFFVGALGFIAAHYVKKWFQLRFFDMFVAAFLIGILAILSVDLGLAKNIDNIIIGAVMPLVPGVAITNSFRDILAGDLISGTARGTEAIFTAAAIGVGIATVFSFFGGGI
ncbi:threonine/serine exporter family protein [Enterococcus mediterraneensis]|uniref:threonine/serine exporter family protein n=1 Tax=Enterococcus mediterraneensis TaxID=2364791 RepID=UPI000F05CE0B|nr:threonine/serine exporter family protein [Enterococcus mediterraneensis]